ncbi:MAG: SMI1/KNR4 family protein [Phenylobacterium sp.]|uniref:SMI1/KNR4 family protein n=1 Tax=Phenylobacterium sp. TaxID=1871053 RepID=UPI001A63456E|nr:SMI1/KNR4 family protein [Phenylobacterium sp.]MBL8772477.1 SMI1/KNR4 family protein [Phenylobacterium sp.]
MSPAELALQRFATKWGSPHTPPVVIDPGDLAITEYSIGRLFPRAYHDALVAVGLPRLTGSLLTSIVEADADCGDVGEFFTPAETIARLDDYRTAATPAAFVPFASDCMGDRYGFLCPASGEPRPTDAPVVRMDHETGEVAEVAGSFVDWLQDYDAIEFVHFEDVQA